LVELVFSVSVTAVLMTGIASALVMASRALPSNKDANASIADTTAMTDQMANDLYVALSFSERTARTVRFTVPDCTGDDVPDMIRYAWSGTNGDPLTRQLNNLAAASVLDDVGEFTLSYDVRSIAETPPPQDNESAVSILSANPAALLPGDFKVTDKGWIGQYFVPSLPADAVSWKVTQVRFMARRHGLAAGETAIQLELPTPAKVPSGDVVGSPVIMHESALSAAYRWEPFDFTDVVDLSPSQGLCLVLKSVGADIEAGDILFDTAGGTNRLTTANAGALWTRSLLTGMVYYVYGTVTTVSQPPAATRYFVEGARIGLATGTDPTSRVETRTSILNEPEIVNP